MQRRHFLKSVAAGGAVTSTLSMPAIAQGKMQWRLATTWDEDSDSFREVQAFAKLVAEGSDGQLQLEVLPDDGQPAAELPFRISRGDVEMGHSFEGWGADAAPAWRFIATMPFGLTYHEKRLWLQHGDGEALADAAFDPIGCKFLPMSELGMQMGGWFTNELTGPADLKGLRIRIFGLGADVLKAAGAEAVRLPRAKIAEAFENDELDAAEYIGPDVDQQVGLHKYAKYYYYPGWQEPSHLFALLINKSKWAELPGRLQSVIRNAATVVDQRSVNTLYAAHQIALPTLLNEHGVQLRRYPENALKALFGHANEVLPAIANKDPHSEKIYDSIVAFRQEVHGWTSIADPAYVMARAKVMT